MTPVPSSTGLPSSQSTVMVPLTSLIQRRMTQCRLPWFKPLASMDNGPISSNGGSPLVQSQVSPSQKLFVVCGPVVRGKATKFDLKYVGVIVLEDSL